MKNLFPEFFVFLPVSVGTNIEFLNKQLLLKTNFKKERKKKASNQQSFIRDLEPNK